MFSSRLPASLAPNAVTVALARARARGRTLLDLTETNPTAVGLHPSVDALQPLADPRALTYDPHPFGRLDAREAVADDYRRRDVTVNPAHVVLTASTSEAYALIFKLLADPGDEVLVPQPGYPLFDLLTRLEAVAPVPYRLDWHGRWSIDRGSVSAALSDRTRAIVVVSPNNPTGSMLHRDDRDWLVALAADRAIAIVADEVFADYPLAPREDACALAGTTGALTFSLGGLSKSAGLPQVKLGWIATSGPGDAVTAALDRLELIADTYLSVSTPVQIAAPALIRSGASTRHAILRRLEQNLATLRGAVASAPAVTLLEPEGGWSVPLRVPAMTSEDALVRRLIDEDDVVVHPGYFFDFDREAFVVVSLLPEPAVFTDAIDRLLRRVAEPRG